MERADDDGLSGRAVNQQTGSKRVNLCMRICISRDHLFRVQNHLAAPGGIRYVLVFAMVTSPLHTPTRTLGLP